MDSAEKRWYYQVRKTQERKIKRNRKRKVPERKREKTKGFRVQKEKGENDYGTVYLH